MRKQLTAGDRARIEKYKEKAERKGMQMVIRTVSASGKVSVSRAYLDILSIESYKISIFDLLFCSAPHRWGRSWILSIPSHAQARWERIETVPDLPKSIWTTLCKTP